MSRLSAFVLAALLCTPLTAFASPPGTMNYQGVLRDSAGAPITVATPVVFSIWDADTGGAMLWSESTTVTPTAGVFEVVLGATTALDPADFATGPLWLEVEVNGTALTPRQELTSVPWALNAATADALADDPAPASYQVPLGGIIDWYAFSASDPVPDGYAICDGSAISDPLSPFLGETLPNLVDAFAMGVATAGATGTTGGANSVNLVHQHQAPTHSHSVPSHTHTAPSHTHTIAGHSHTVNSHSHSMSHTHTVGSHTHSIGSHSHGGLHHRHRWSRWVQGNSRFDTFSGGASDTATSADETMNANDIGEEGTGTSALAKGISTASEYFYTSGRMNGSSGGSDTTDGTSLTTAGSGTLTSNGSSAGSTGNSSPGTSSTSLTTASGGGSQTGAHSDTTGTNAAATTGDGGNPAHDNRPAWVGLLKIMRIR